MQDVSNYSEIINRLKKEVEAARLNAAFTVNRQMLVYTGVLVKLSSNSRKVRVGALKLSTGFPLI